MPDFEIQEPGAGGGDGFGPIPEDTVLRATFVDCFETTKENKDKTEKYLRYDWKFRVNDPTSEHDGRILHGDTSRVWVAHEGCKAYMWVRALMGTDLPPGFKGNTDAVKDMDCRVVVGARTYTKKGETEESTYNFVTDVMPLRSYEESTF